MANNLYNTQQGAYPIAPVNLRTVDQAVMDYFTKRLSLSVQTADDARFSVPVIFAGSERWKAIRDGQGVRDENGTLILPVISVRRTNISREKGKAAMATEQPSITVSKRTSPKTSAFQNLLSKRQASLGFPQAKPQPEITEYLTIPFPDFCTVYYEIIIWAQYQAQMNEILEQIVYAFDYNDSFVMPVDSDQLRVTPNYFVGYVDGDITSQSNFDEMTENERLVKYTYNIRVPAYFILDITSQPLAYGFDKGRRESRNEPMVYKSEGAVQITITEGFLNTAQQIALVLSGTVPN